MPIELSAFIKHAFVGEQVNLDNTQFIECTFERCNLIFGGVGHLTLTGCKFFDCTWTFSGPAANTIHFLTAMYAMGATQLVEATFENVRKGSHQPPPGTATGSILVH